MDINKGIEDFISTDEVTNILNETNKWIDKPPKLLYGIPPIYK